MIKSIIFDWSGTLSDNFHLFCKVVEKICEVKGKTPLSIEEIRETFDLPYMKFWNKHFPKMTKEEEEKLYSKYIHQIGTPDVFPQVSETLQKLHSDGIRLFVVSSDLKTTLLPEIQKAGLENVFSEVKDFVHEKEHAISELIQKYNLNPKETAFVGDTSGEVLAGKKAGVKTISITWGFSDRKRLIEAKPDALIDSIIELEKALKTL